jgi:hypothetical protein
VTAVATPPAKPQVLARRHASHDRPCPQCEHLIKKGDRVAQLSTRPDAHVCARCTP